MDKRKTRLLVMVIVIIALMAAPMIYLNSKLGSANDDPGYQALEVYGRSLSGDTSADAEALEVYPSLTKVTIKSQEIFTRQGKDACWKLDPSLSFKPVLAEKELCTK